MFRQFLLLVFLTLTITLTRASDLTPLICLDEADALALINQARPHDALMHFFYSDYTDTQFTTLLQRYGLVRDIANTTFLDVRRYCWPPAWRLSNESIIGFDTETGINCTALNVSEDTPQPAEVSVLFHILTCYQDLIVGDLCTDPNVNPVFVGFSNTGVPLYVMGCLPGKVCADSAPDQAWFVGATTAGLVAFAVLIIGTFVSIHMLKAHLGPVTEYAMIGKADI